MRVGNFSYLNQTKLSLHTLCRYQSTTVGRVGSRYVWQGGQTENQGGQAKIFFGDSRRILSKKCLPTLAWNRAGAHALNPAGELPSHRPSLLFPRSKFLATPLFLFILNQVIRVHTHNIVGLYIPSRKTSAQTFTYTCTGNVFCFLSFVFHFVTKCTVFTMLREYHIRYHIPERNMIPYIRRPDKERKSQTGPRPEKVTGS